MSNFYLSDPKLFHLTNLHPLHFKIYEYCCSQFNCKTQISYIRLVDIAGLFQINLQTVQEAMIELSKIKIDDEQLIKITQQEKYVEFTMPRYLKFIKTVGFEKFNSGKAWSAIKNHLQKRIVKKYLYNELDQHELYDKLKDLPKEDLFKVNENDLRYPWVLRNVKKAIN